MSEMDITLDRENQQTNKMSTKKTAGRKRMYHKLWSATPGVKEQFIDYLENDTPLKPATFITYKYIMYKISDYEINILDCTKDLYEFTDIEIDNMIRYFKISSETSIKSYIAVINLYLLFCSVEQGIGVMKNRLVIEYIRTSEEIKNLLLNKIKQDKELVSREEIYNEILPNVKNPQDRLPYVLSFEGLTPREQINLKVDDVDLDDNLIMVGDRIIKVPEETIEIIHQAITMTTYYAINGTGADKRGDPIVLTTKYICRPTDRMLTNKMKEELTSYDNLQVGLQLIRKRLYETSRSETIQRNNLNLTVLRDAGMMECLNQNKDRLESTDMNTEDFQKILYNRFGTLSLAQINRIKNVYLSL